MSLTNPILLQRLEGLAALGLSIAAYAILGQSWLVFGLLFLAPDLAMLGYLRSPKTGAASYNLVHTYAAPGVLALLGLAVGPLAYGLAAIWSATSASIVPSATASSSKPALATPTSAPRARPVATRLRP